MTSTSQDDSVAVESAPGDTDEDGGPASGAAGRRPRAIILAAASGAVAMICAILLPLLPVSVDRPVVTWPQVAGAPESTALGLTTQRPLTLDAGFSCADARAAAATPGGLVLSTAPPGFPDAQAAALVATSTGDLLTVTSRGTALFQGPLPNGPCDVAIRGDLSGLALQVDGVTAGTLPGDALPDVDALATGLTGTRSQLQVRLTLDDQGATSPTPLKLVAIVLLALASAVSLVALWVADRPLRTTGRRRIPRPGVVDVVVPLVMVVWLFLAPMTDDDGYYSAMAANVSHSGYVANYFQLFNQSFTPFTWIYYALGWWQDAVGTAPVLLRVPALALGVLTWFLVRLFARRVVPTSWSERWTGRAFRVVLAICFLGWWLPYDMGVRPEAVVAASVMASLVALVASIERGLALPAGLAVLSAGIGFTAGTAGFVALAPVLAATPAVWRMLGSRGPWGRVLTIVAVAAAGSVVGLLAFGDGSLRDFSRAQQIFLGMQYPETWSTEIVRWNYLLNKPGAQGNYAKRLPVLLTLFAVVGYLVAAGAGRGRVPTWPPRVRLVLVTTVLGFLLLWMTPSKWTHHFGALAGVGTILIASVIVLGARMARAASAERPFGRPVAVGALVGVSVLIALAGQGINSWPYSWLLGLPHPLTPPQVWIVKLGQPVWWLLGSALVTAAVVVVARRRAPSLAVVAPWLALPVVVCVAFLATTGYMLGGFALATARTAGTYSPWADAIEDPLAHRCGAEQAVQVLDPRTATAVPVASLAGASDGGGVFSPQGWSPSSPPPIGAVPVWGSHRPGQDSADPPDGAGAGSVSTPWYSLPPTTGAAALAFYVAGRTGDGNDVRVEYASLGAPGATPTPLGGSAHLGEGHDDASVDARQWRSISLDGPSAPPRGATAVRLVATDASDGPGGWTALTAPVVEQWRPLADVVPPGSATGVGWSLAFLFPCLRKPVQADGVNEPVATAVTGGEEPLDGVGDSAFQAKRGGLYMQSYRGSAATELSARLADFPAVPGIQVYTFRSTLPSGRYTLEHRSEVVPGRAPAPNTTFSTPVGPEAVVRP